jgi:dnd system-associated protein 4
MATIRISQSAEPFLPFCQTSGSSKEHIWITYADLVAFLAAFAFSEEAPLAPKISALKSMNSIDLDIFRRRGLYEQLLLIAIAEKRNWIVAKSPDEIASIAERYAEAGAKMLESEARIGNVERLAERLLQLIQQSSNLDRAPQI